MGWRRVAERELAVIEPRTRAGAGGVRRRGQRLPRLARPEPTWPWSTPCSSSAGSTTRRSRGRRSTRWPGSRRWRGTCAATWTTRSAGRSRRWTTRRSEVAQLYPPYPFDDHPPIVGSGARRGRRLRPGRDRAAPATRSGRRRRTTARPHALERVQDALDAVPALVGRGDGIGSNSWVVGGEHTTTGQPLLANDPHLGISLPGIWMQMGLHCRTVSADCPMDVAGFTFSGVPGRDHRPQRRHRLGVHQPRPRRHRPLPRAGARPTSGATTRSGGRSTCATETIEVRGGDDVELRIRATDHGPLLSDVLDELRHGRRQRAATGRRDEDFAVSLAWTALQPIDHRRRDPRAQPGDGLGGVPRRRRRLRRPRAEHGVRRPRGPHRLPGAGAGPDPAVRQRRVACPPRAGGPRTTGPGSSSRSTGCRTCSTPRRASSSRPTRRSIGEDYPFYLTDDWDHGYRSARIRDRIEADPRLSVAEMAALQNDDLNPMAATLVPYLLDVDDLRAGYYRDGQDLLRDWDGRQPARDGQRRGGVLQRRVARPAAADLPRRAARSRCGPRAGSGGTP